METFKKDKHGCHYCYLMGHRYMNHRHCDRCGLPDYVADERGTPNLLPRLDWRWFHLKMRYHEFRGHMFGRCLDPRCNKIDRVWNWRFGKHDKCDALPF
jgi:hypothetical protein